MRSTSQYKNAWRHLLYWCIYLVYFYAINLLGNDKISPITVLMSFPYFAAIFYIVLRILRHYFYRNKIKQGCIALVCFYTVSGAVLYTATHNSPILEVVYQAYLNDAYSFNIREFLQTFLIMHGHFTMLAFLSYQYQNKIRAIKQQLHEIRLRHDYEYSALAEQISPHMLTNLLQNSIMKLRATDPQIADQFNDLYGLMNYYTDAHAPGSAKTILISSEIEAVKKYIRSNQALSSQSFFIKWQITGNINRGTLPPTSLICLVENAIKYGEISDKECPLNIEIEIRKSSLYLSVRNKKRLISQPPFSGRGSGLQSLRRRLQIAYPKGHRFIVRNEKLHFVVKILIHY